MDGPSLASICTEWNFAPQTSLFIAPIRRQLTKHVCAAFHHPPRLLPVIKVVDD